MVKNPLYASRRFWSFVIGAILMVAVNTFDLNINSTAQAELTHYLAWLIGALVAGYSVQDVIASFRTKIEISGVLDDFEDVVGQVLQAVKDTIKELPVTDDKFDATVIKVLENKTK